HQHPPNQHSFPTRRSSDLDSEVKNIDMVNMILDHLGKPKSLITFVNDRLGHDRRYAIDSAKTRTELNWRPLRRLDKALPETIDRSEEHTSELQSLRHLVCR